MSPASTNTHPLEDLIAFAREHAPFYRSLYAGLPERLSLTQIPIIEQDTYWQAHHHDRQSVLTGPLINGVVFNSGGTTGAPKYSYFDNQEWRSIITLSARAYEAAGLQDGDRVANLFASGNLYASFIFATESLKWTRPQLLQLPLGFSTNLAPVATIIHQFKANVLAGFPTHLLRIIEHIDQEKLEGVRIDRVLYAGELFTKDQQDFLETRFPGIQVRSAGYASVDAGLIGYADAGCQAGEHRVFDRATRLEIIDEATDEPLEEAGQSGRIVFTSLVRRLMPLLRYPTGDRAQWVDPPDTADRKFQLLGRSEESARVAHYTVGFSEAAALLAPWQDALGIEQFQLMVQRDGRLDRLVFRVVAAGAPGKLEAAKIEILDHFRRKRGDIHETADGGRMHLPDIQWVRHEELLTNPRTGKLLRIVDLRNS